MVQGFVTSYPAAQWKAMRNPKFGAETYAESDPEISSQHGKAVGHLPLRIIKREHKRDAPPSSNCDIQKYTST